MAKLSFQDGISRQLFLRIAPPSINYSVIRRAKFRAPVFIGKSGQSCLDLVQALPNMDLKVNLHHFLPEASAYKSENCIPANHFGVN